MDAIPHIGAQFVAEDLSHHILFHSKVFSGGKVVRLRGVNFFGSQVIRILRKKKKRKSQVRKKTLYSSSRYFNFESRDLIPILSASTNEIHFAPRTIIQDSYASAYSWNGGFNAAEHIEFHFQQTGAGILSL